MASRARRNERHGCTRMVDQQSKRDMHMKIYNVEGQVQAWVRSHSAELYDDILVGAEDAAPYEDDRVIVCSIRSLTGVTDYVLRTPDEVVKSLQKAIN